MIILENWINFEKTIEANEENVELLKKKLPTKVKRRRKIKKQNDNEIDTNNANDDNEGWEEYYDYIFPDDEDQRKNIKILEHAIGWHKNLKNNTESNEN